MIERFPKTEVPSPRARHQLRVAVFDLSTGELIGNMQSDRLLLRDFQVVNDQGLPGIDNERRAERIGTRQGIPFKKPLSSEVTLKNVSTNEDHVRRDGSRVTVTVRPDVPLNFLPPMNSLGSLSSSSEHVHGHAVALRAPMDFRNLSAGLRRYEATEVLDLAQREIEDNGATNLDTHDAELIVSGFARINELSSLAVRSSQY